MEARNWRRKTPNETFLDAMPDDQGENDRGLTATDTKKPDRSQIEFRLIQFNAASSGNRPLRPL